MQPESAAAWDIPLPIDLPDSSSVAEKNSRRELIYGQALILSLAIRACGDIDTPREMRQLLVAKTLETLRDRELSGFVRLEVEAMRGVNLATLASVRRLQYEATKAKRLARRAITRPAWRTHVHRVGP